MRAGQGKLMLALGRDTAGAPVVMDLTHAPHLLIAGATGSGKSVCINTIITSLLDAAWAGIVAVYHGRPQDGGIARL